MTETFNLNKALLSAGAAQEDIDAIHTADPDRVNQELPLSGNGHGWSMWVESLPEAGGTRYLGLYVHYQQHQHPVPKTKLTLLYDRQEKKVGTEVPAAQKRDRIADWHTTKADVLAALRNATPRPGKPARALLQKLLAHMA